MELTIFKNNELGEVRALNIGGEPWFVAKDVCDILEIRNTTDAIKRLDVDEVTRFNLGGLSGKTNIVNEYGLYSLILGSRKPEAKQFKRWITHDVLPSIRKHGMYAKDELLADPDLMISIIQELKAEREAKKKLQIENVQQKQIISEMNPKVSYYDNILQNKDLVSITKISKDYGMSAIEMNKILHELGIQFKQSGMWLLYQKYANKGYTSSKTFENEYGILIMHTYWTQKGRLFLYDLLKNKMDLVPLIEREEGDMEK